jgi:pSer/pThr/pTyr-binding forkhead associated (FHA) protein
VVIIFVEGASESVLRGLSVASKMRVGRDEDVEIHLPDGQASRVHAEVGPSKGGVLVTDLGSRNGTFVNGERISGTRALAEGDEVRIGSVSLLVRYASADASTRTPRSTNPGRDSRS